MWAANSSTSRSRRGSSICFSRTTAREASRASVRLTTTWPAFWSKAGLPRWFSWKKHRHTLPRAELVADSEVDKRLGPLKVRVRPGDDDVKRLPRVDAHRISARAAVEFL